ncbi:HAD family hydrolase [Evansella clarkii]|uniref:HAD family hydrolase n=1 Tax=Evansella clarkii TaxID=79879 RepID=UPI0014765E76|nr:HAD-IA family hydrolase [Evansella clarkii]
MGIKGIGFDLDNTLYSHEEAFEKAIKYCFSAYIQKEIEKSRLIQPEEFFHIFKNNCDKYWSMFEKKKISGKEYHRIRFNETMKNFNLPGNDKASERFHSLYYKVVSDFSTPFPAMAELLSYLARKQISMSIITNGKIKTQHAKIQSIGADKWIKKENTIISEEAGFEKPQKEIFQLAENKLCLKAEQLLYVGDTWKHDVEGPINAGWQAVYLNSREASPDSAHRPAATVKKLADVKDYLAEIFGRRETP